MSREMAARALSRFGYGARPGDLERIAADPKAALLSEIDRPSGARLDDEGLLSAHDAFAAQRRQDREREAGANDPEIKKKPYVSQMIMETEVEARIRRIADVSTGFEERLVSFWANHFCVQRSVEGPVRGMAGAFEREAIRPHVLGRFQDMLFAATSHPAMLLSLNNASSVGPDSVVGQRDKRGINENHAREIMELHTIGVTGGYDQDDVTAFARVLTGWSFGRSDKQPETLGRFQFNPKTHQPGAENVLGVSYSETGQDQGLAVLAGLAARPATARHIATKLAVHFVSDTPPQGLVDRLAERFTETSGDLQAVTELLVESDESWSAPPTKLRTPQEFVWSSIRALQIEPKQNLVFRAFNTLGQPLWDPPSPAGFKDDVATWLAPAAITTRIEIAEQFAGLAKATDPRIVADSILGEALSARTRETIARAETPQQGLALLLMSPEFQRR